MVLQWLFVVKQLFSNFIPRGCYGVVVGGLGFVQLWFYFCRNVYLLSVDINGFATDTFFMRWIFLWSLGDSDVFIKCLLSSWQGIISFCYLTQIYSTKFAAPKNGSNSLHSLESYNIVLIYRIDTIVLTLLTLPLIKNSCMSADTNYRSHIRVLYMWTLVFLWLALEKPRRERIRT